MDPSSLHPPTGGFQQLLLEPVLKFHYMLKKLQLHKEEYVLMQAISLFSPGESPTCPSCLVSPGLLTPRQLQPRAGAAFLPLLSPGKVPD